MSARSRTAVPNTNRNLAGPETGLVAQSGFVVLCGSRGPRGRSVWWGRVLPWRNPLHWYRGFAGWVLGAGTSPSENPEKNAGGTGGGVQWQISPTPIAIATPLQGGRLERPGVLFLILFSSEAPRNLRVRSKKILSLALFLLIAPHRRAPPPPHTRTNRRNRADCSEVTCAAPCGLCVEGNQTEASELLMYPLFVKSISSDANRTLCL